MTKTDLLSGLSEIAVTPTTSTPEAAAYQTTCYQLAEVMLEIARDPEATARFVATMAQPRDEIQEGSVRLFTIAQEDLVEAGELDQVTHF